MKRSSLGALAGMLLPLVHFLLELFRLLFVHKREARHALLQFEGVKEGTVLIVVEGIVDLLIPYHTSIGGLVECQRVLLCPLSLEGFRS